MHNNIAVIMSLYKNDIFDYFTLDDSGNAKIATWIREEGKYNSNNTTSFFY